MQKSLLIMEQELWKHKEPREIEQIGKHIEHPLKRAPYRDKVIIID